ncbi:MAG: hypothetical protein JNK05_07505 [Myxococcales bacterium]|nr:hypothetical protein [Myxococcales bacterium]
MKRQLLLFSLALGACSRGAQSPPVARASTRPVPTTIARVEPRPLLQGETPTQEIMERVEETSEFAGNSQGLEQLVRALTDAIRRGDDARANAIVAPVRARRSPLLLALTFEGGRSLSGYLTGPASLPNDALITRARAWTAATSISVHLATGAEIVRGERAGEYASELRRIGTLLRDGVTFYRVSFRYANGRTEHSDLWVYAGARWMFVPEPWRFAEGSPDRATVVPTPATFARVPPGRSR